MKVLYSVLVGFGSILYVVYVIHLLRIGHSQPLIFHTLIAIALFGIIHIGRKRTPEHHS